MDILLSIIAWIGCWSAMMVNAPDYVLINAINQSSEGKLSYFFIKLMKRSYNLIFLILLNLFCFITQFFILSQDLKFVLFVINIMFFIMSTNAFGCFFFFICLIKNDWTELFSVIRTLSVSVLSDIWEE